MIRKQIKVIKQYRTGEPNRNSQPVRTTLLNDDLQSSRYAIECSYQNKDNVPKPFMIERSL